MGNQPVVFIKNMVCQRCIKVVKEILVDLGITFQQVNLGEVHLDTTLSKEQATKLHRKLQQDGFEILGDKNAKTVERIKNTIIEYVHQPEKYRTHSHWTFSSFLSKQLAQDYTSLSQLFSSVEGITIEKYLIHQRIEKVKELLKYGELNLTEIAQRTGYSSVQYLSNQFKRVTGLSPNQFKKLNLPRHGIDSV
ncbi:MAG: AraC family transcriptional regulator [Cyclobacteriaceae bacterium]|nr:AraC family transcriptional regulator [Cyclobacteriaceae bacterium]